MIRRAAVAGAFYPAGEAELRRQIADLTAGGPAKIRAKAVVAPHAGYVYSGGVAGAVYASVALPARFVILAPAHRPIRPEFAVMTSGAWETPLGRVPVDDRLARAVLDLAPFLADDPAAHRDEHSLEVQLPFLQVLAPGLSIVPIAVSHKASLAELEDLGRAIGRAVRESETEALVVASTDMSHYVSAAEARRKDARAIDRILALDPRGLYRTVRDEDISMCGVLPTVAALAAALEMGAAGAELIRYATSGDVTGDDREVVGYAGLRVR